MCVDPTLGIISILLTNRVYPMADAASSTKIHAARTAFSNMVLHVLSMGPDQPQSPTSYTNIIVGCFIGTVLAGVAIALVHRWWTCRQSNKPDTKSAIYAEVDRELLQNSV